MLWPMWRWTGWPRTPTKNSSFGCTFTIRTFPIIAEPYSREYAAQPYDGEMLLRMNRSGGFSAFERERDLSEHGDRALRDHGESLGEHGEKRMASLFTTPRCMCR